MLLQAERERPGRRWNGKCFEGDVGRVVNHVVIAARLLNRRERAGHGRCRGRLGSVDDLEQLTGCRGEARCVDGERPPERRRAADNELVVTGARIGARDLDCELAAGTLRVVVGQGQGAWRGAGGQRAARVLYVSTGDATRAAQRSALQRHHPTG